MGLKMEAPVGLLTGTGLIQVV